MSTVIAIIFQNQFCLASDTKVSCRDDDLLDETIVKQVEVNPALAIGFTGTFVVAEAILRSIESWKMENYEEKINSVRVDDLPDNLTFLFKDFISKHEVPDFVTPHATALIIGLDRADQPAIARWSSKYPCKIAHQSDPDNFTAIVLPPSDMSEGECIDIASSLASSPEFDGSLPNLSANYVRSVASKSKFVNETRTLWISNFP